MNTIEIQMETVAKLTADAGIQVLKDYLVELGLFDLTCAEDLEMTDDDIRDMGIDYFGGSDEDELDDAIHALRSAV